MVFLFLDGCEMYQRVAGNAYLPVFFMPMVSTDWCDPVSVAYVQRERCEA